MEGRDRGQEGTHLILANKPHLNLLDLDILLDVHQFVKLINISPLNMPYFTKINQLFFGRSVKMQYLRK